MTFKDQVVNLFNTHSELSVRELTELTDASRQMIHIVIKQLVEDNQIEKLGRPPKTIYRLKSDKKVLQTPNITITEVEESFLNLHFLVITEVGEMKNGLDGFTYWCKNRNLPVQKTINEFIATRKKYLSYYSDSGVIDGANKLVNTEGYESIWLDKLFYLDFYAIERFGKTRLGVLLHYAKQGQNKYLMGIMLDEIKDRIHSFIHSQKIDAIGFVPPTIRRETQIMRFMRDRLKIPLHVLDIKKISGIIPVPQKSLSKLDERIRNAENTFSVTERLKFNHVLLIDDAVGSGSTLNQIAGKIKAKKISTQVTGLAVVGSFKGFDVITDV